MLERQVLANTIISYGDRFIVNDYNFQYAAMRKKVLNESTGKVEKHKKAGAAIGNNAPATLITLIDSKLKAKAGISIEKMKLKDIDYSEKIYREICAKKLLESL